MKKIYFATTNKKKIASINQYLNGVVKVISVDMEIPESRADETNIIAEEKVIYAFKHINKPCIAQDGGFYIDSLNGFPRAFVNFAMETIGIKGILKLLEGKDRVCEFRDTLAYMDDKLKKPLLFETITRGTLTTEPRGKLNKHNLSDLHKIFIPFGENKTLAEMEEKEIEKWRKTIQADWYGNKFAKWIKNKQ